MRPIVQSGIDASLAGGYIIDGTFAYEIRTTASVSGPITLCFYASAADDPAAFAALRVSTESVSHRAVDRAHLQHPVAL